MTCRIDVVSDAEAAFASGTSAPDGTVIVGGTGSVAARIVDRRKTSWYGGWGWLLGDEGSAYWIGRQAVRSTLRLLEGQGAPGPLALAVLAETFGDKEAAELLAEHARATRSPGETTPIVLAGSVIGPDSPVGRALRERLSHEAEVLFSPDGAVGAAWLAALSVWGPDAPRPAV